MKCQLEVVTEVEDAFFFFWRKKLKMHVHLLREIII